MAKYLIGIDEGSQSAKISIFDISGNVIASESVKLRRTVLGTRGEVEHPDDDLWDKLCCASKKVMDAFEGDKSDIAGVGLCTIRFCRCMLKEDGTLSMPARNWMDIRVSRPYVHENPQTKYVTTSSGYITRRMTGSNNDSAANCLGIWPMDTDTWQWHSDEKKLSEFGVKRDMLFDLQLPGEVAGYITKAASIATGIPEGLPVITTANDKAVEALGMGLVDGSAALISLGTYIASMVMGEKNAPATGTYWTNMSCIPKRYLYESTGIRRGMWMLSWFIDTLGDGFRRQCEESGMLPEEVLNVEAEAVPAGCDGLITVPDWLAPTDRRYRKGAMLGFDGRHTRGHIYRSILEAIALTMANHLSAMTGELGQSVSKAMISGGGAGSGVFMQIFADVLNMPVTRNLKSGGAGLGAAICASVGTNIYSSFGQAVEHMIKKEYCETFYPNPAASEVYQNLNTKVYKDLSRHLEAPLKGLYDIFG